ncbi:MAG: hypothetical protein AAFZ18_10600 [Myxococcota bacterium]
MRPAGPGSDSPLDLRAALVAGWIDSLTKALRGARVYAKNNEMYRRFVDRTHGELSRVLEQLGEVSLSIREDRLLFEQQVVHQDPDLREGLPFSLYNNAFRRLTFLPGMSREEIVALIAALNVDYQGLDFTSEDLVSALWRLRLPHLRYVTIDALNMTRQSSEELSPEQQDMHRLQVEVESLVAAIYRNGASEDEVVAGVSIGPDDLEALRELRSGAQGQVELDDLDSAPSDGASLDDAAATSLNGDDLDALTRRLMAILARALCKGRSVSAGSATLELFQQLYDSLLLTQRYVNARSLVDWLRATSEYGEDMQEMHISRHLLRLLAAERRVLPILEGLNDGYLTVPATELVDFLRVLGPQVVPALLHGLESVDSAGHRKMICELIVELGVPDVHVLEARAVDAKWFVVRDLLQLARQHPVGQITRLVYAALRHDHPKVRAQGVRILRDYGPGVADRLLAERLRDDDAEVRVLAARVSASRRPADMLESFRSLLTDETLGQRGEGELRMLLGAFAILGQGVAVAPLGTFLDRSFLNRMINGADLQVAAAYALGRIPREAARDHLRKGLRSLNSRVREACRGALTQSLRSPYESERGRSPGGSEPDPFEHLPADTMSFVPEAAARPEPPSQLIDEASSTPTPRPEISHRDIYPVPDETLRRREVVSRMLPPSPAARSSDGADTRDLWPQGRPRSTPPSPAAPTGEVSEGPRPRRRRAEAPPGAFTRLGSIAPSTEPERPCEARNGGDE